MLGWLNRLLGAAFGTIKMLLLLSVILNFVAIMNQFVPIKDKPIVQQSLLYSPIENTMSAVLPLLNFEDFTTAVREGVIEPATKAILIFSFSLPFSLPHSFLCSIFLPSDV